MSFVTERTALEGKFAAWTETRVKYVGRPFLEPAVAYIYPVVIDGAAQEVTFGQPIQRRHVGVISILILDKENKTDGDARIRAIADMLEALFIGANSRVTISTSEYIDFSAPSLSSWSQSSGWQQRTLTIPFTRDHFQ